MPLCTTTIGAFPKPAEIAVADWRQHGHDDDGEGDGEGRVRVFSYAGIVPRAVPEALLDRATRAAVADQVACGIAVPTDGEQRRENYIHYHCRHLDGIDFARLTRKRYRGGSAAADLPTVTGPVAPRGGHFLDRDYAVAQAATARPVKLTVPGPLTVVDTTADVHYGSDRALARDLAAALNHEIRALAAAGCRHIQIDETVFARRVDDALGFGIDCLERCFEGLADDVTRIVHICCGYPGRLDEAGYPKADPAAYFALAAELDASGVDQVSIEDAHRASDPALLECFARSTVTLGVVDVARSRVESVEEIAGHLERALRHIDADRLVAAPDCGLLLLDRDTAMAKLTNLCLAAAAV